MNPEARIGQIWWTLLTLREVRRRTRVQRADMEKLSARMDVLLERMRKD